MTAQKKAPSDNLSAVPARNPKGAGRKKLATHALYCDPSKVIIPSHSPFGRMIRKVIDHLSEPFLDKPSPFAQTMIDGLAVNIIIAKFFQAAFLRGDEMASSILRDYTTLWNGVSRDLATLSGMAKESGVKDPVPSLEEYLEVVKKEEGKRLAAAERVPPEPVAAKSLPGTNVPTPELDETLQEVAAITEQYTVTPKPANAESAKRTLF